MRYKILIVALFVMIIAVPLQSKPTAKLQKNHTGYTLEFELPDVQIDKADTLGLAVKKGYSSKVLLPV